MLFRRKKYLINTRHQLKYVLLFLGVAMLSFIFSTSSYIHGVSRDVERHISSKNMEITNTGEIVLPVVVEVSLKTSALLAVLLVLIVYVYYSGTKRLAESLNGALSSFKAGDLGCSLKIPGGDFPEMEKAFNDMVSVNREKINTLKCAVDGLGQALDAAASSPDDSAGEGIQSGVLRIKSALSGFSVE